MGSLLRLRVLFSVHVSHTFALLVVPGDLNSIRDTLKLLGDTKLTVKDLETTEVGFSLKRLKTECDDFEVKKAAKSVNKTWKKLVTVEMAV